MELPDIPAVVAECKAKGAEIDLADVTYYVGHETIVPREDGKGLPRLAGSALRRHGPQRGAHQRLPEAPLRQRRRDRARDRDLEAAWPNPANLFISPIQTERRLPSQSSTPAAGSQDYVGDPRNDDVFISVNGELVRRARGQGLGLRFRLRARRRRLGGAAAQRRAHRLPRQAPRPPVGRRQDAAHRHRPDPRGARGAPVRRRRRQRHARRRAHPPDGDARRQALALPGPAPDHRRRDDRHHPRMEAAAAGNAGARARRCSPSTSAAPARPSRTRSSIRTPSSTASSPASRRWRPAPTRR